MKESPLYEEIKDEGRIETLQAAVVEALEVRFGAESSTELSDAVHRVSKPAKLSRLHRLAIQCDSIEEFEKALKAR